MTDEMRQGQPGEPGEPGEPGSDGGGAGGTGGHGGRGGSATERRRSSAILIFVVVLALGLSAGTLILIAKVHDNADSIQALERSDARQLRKENRDQTEAILAANEAIAAARRAEYRICIRQMVTRAAMNIDLRHDEPPLRLLDCTPNLKGKPASPLSPAQARAFERTVQRNPGAQP